jgi:hypothetical protein
MHAIHLKVPSRPRAATVAKWTYANQRRRPGPVLEGVSVVKPPSRGSLSVCSSSLNSAAGVQWAEKPTVNTTPARGLLLPKELCVCV